MQRFGVTALVASLFLCLACLPSFFVWGMYEDQAGTIDWHRTNLGEVKMAYLPEGKKVAYVASDSGAVAAVHLGKGNIEWKRILPNEETVDLFLYQDDSLITLSGAGKLISAWNAKDGTKTWGASVYSYEEFGQQTESIFKNTNRFAFDGAWLQDIDADSIPDVVTLALDRVQARSGRDGHLLWSWAPQKGDTVSTIHKLHIVNPKDSSGASEGRVYAIGLGNAGEVAITVLGTSKGDVLKRATLKLPAGIASPRDSCITVRPAGQIVCLDAEQQSLLLADVKASSSSEFTKVELKALLPDEPSFARASLGRTAVNNGFVLHLGEERSVVIQFSQKLTPTVVHAFTKGKRVFSSSDEVNDKCFLISTMVDRGEVFLDLLEMKSGNVETSLLVNYTILEHGVPKRVFLNAFARKDSGGYGTRVLLVGEDHSLSLVATAKLLWTREEALASITHTQILDFPAETSVRVALQKEFASDPSDNVFSHFMKRIRYESAQLMSFASSLSFDASDLQALLARFTQRSGQNGDVLLTKDKFGFNKLVVVATAPGKLFALHSLDGSIVWSKYLPRTTPLALYLARGGAHPPPQGVLVASHTSEDGRQHSTVVSSVNLLTGEDIPGESPLVIDAGIKQSFLLPFVEHSSFTHPTILLDAHLRIHVYPANTDAINLVNQHRRQISFYLVDKANGTLEGYGIENLDQPAFLLWNIMFSSQNEEIQAIAVHPANEAIGSPTLSKGDLSIRPKYINRNAIAVATVSSTTYTSATTKKKAFESFVNVYLIDTVTGSFIYRTYFRNAQAPVKLLQSENWLVCHYWNWKAHRYEVSVLEFYEKEMDWNARTFSSHSIPNLEVLSRTYMFPTGVSTMAVTLTARGITTKQILLGLSSDRIVGLDRRWLSARRPHKDQMTDQDRSEGVIPYNIKLPLPATSIVNYNLTIHNLRGIETAPTFLESTSLVFAHGVDLFFTRVTPSQTFDLLNDDFQYIPLVATIVVLVVLSFVTTWLVARKNLAKRWR